MIISKQSFLIVVLACAPWFAAAAQEPAPTTQATLAGVVRDSTGVPLGGVEILITETTHGTRSDSAGRFVLANIPPGAYRVWFRRLGYSSKQFDWAANVSQRTEVAVVLTPIARTLDPVVVRAEEDKAMAAKASILGLVIDSTGVPIEEAEVQLVGANQGGLTRANGGFLFRPLPVGPYVIRVRKIGFEPSVLKLGLVEGDDREVIIRMRRLSAALDPVVITERSGYDKRDQLVYDDLEKRMRWKSMRNPILGPEDLRRYEGLELDYAMKAMAIVRPNRPSYAVNSLYNQKDESKPSRLDELDNPVCILLNGKTPLYQPLRTFGVKELDLLEVYPGGTELTGTVGARMMHPPCIPSGVFMHPTYYVVWLKGSR